MNSARRVHLSRSLKALGVIAVLWGVLHVTSSAFGGAPRQRGFQHRRPYNQVKEATHGAFLGLLWRAGLGAVLIVAGARLAPKAPE